MFEFTGLRVFHNDMKKHKETRAIFDFEYNCKKFSCIFITDVIPYRLYVTTLGKNPIVFELEVEKGYMVKSYLDDYKKLIEYLGLKYSPDHIFKPSDFFAALNKSIPKNFRNKPSYTEVLRVVSKKRRIEEADKIYFCGWYSNPDGKFVRPENLEKTRNAFGDKKAKLCQEKNISSCWTDIAKDEKLNELDLKLSK